MILWIVVPALINGALAVVIVMLSRRSWVYGVAGCVAVLAAYTLALAAWPDAKHSWRERLEVYEMLAGIIWVPGALLAVWGGRLHGWFGRVLRGLSVTVAVCLGGSYLYSALVLLCNQWGQCP
jgi:hypothetical protein